MVSGFAPVPSGVAPLTPEVAPVLPVVDCLPMGGSCAAPLPPGVSGVNPLPLVGSCAAPLPPGVNGVNPLPPVVNGLTSLAPVRPLCCVAQLLVTIPTGLYDIAIHCWAALACWLVVGSPLDGVQMLRIGSSGTGVLARYVFEVSFANG